MFDKIVEWCKKSEKQDTQSDATSITYRTLTPTDDAKDCEAYMNALSWALKQDKIHNIAVSGPYGSGKSSVIRTFFREHPNYKCITISLANFKGDDESSKDANNNTPIQVDVKVKKGDKEQLSLSKTESAKVLDSNLEQQIERSIVQQLFYHEKDSEIPNSHFQKIKKQDDFELFCLGLFVILFLLSIFYVTYPDKFWNYLYIIHAPKTLKQILHLLALVTIVIGTYKIIVHIIQITIGLSVKYLHFKNTELALEKKEDKSILNYYIDEIIYFFEETEHNVVVIEDLDRFDNQNIFIKLREINYLINNCKKIEHKVVFVYAIKDEMFIDKDRTKFFDFIIPIIPVVNYSNSGEILRRELLPAEGSDKNDTTIIHENVIDTLSLFIDDLRLLYNIINEYKIYRNLLSSKKDNENSSERSEEVNSTDSINENPDGLHLIADRLLAIITYKNLYPQDFSDIVQRKGLLYNIIASKKDTYINAAIKKCNEEIAQKEERIKTIETSDKPFSASELRLIYVQKIAEELHPNLLFFIINKQRKTLSECAQNEELFNTLISGNKIDYRYYNSNYMSDQPGSSILNFHNVEKKVHELTYQQRLDLLFKTELDELRNQMRALRRSIEEYKQYSLAELMRENKYAIDSKLTKGYPQQQIDFLNVVLREGYINENYWEYISVFYPGSLTYEDKQFVLDVFAGRSNPYDYHINLVENVLKKITKESTKYLKDKASLNFDLMDHIVSNASIANSEPYMLQMSSHPDFVIQYIERGGKALGNFMNLLCVYWPKFWQYILANYSKDKDHYLYLIIKYSLIENIISIFKDQKHYLEEYADFLVIDTEREKLHSLISEMDLLFKELNPESDKSELEYIYSQGYYQMNLQMLRVLLSKQDKWDESAFMARNYDYICDNYDLMAEYIHSDLSEYIDNVFLAIDSPQTITSEHLKELLNSEDISNEQKKRIVQKSECEVEHIIEITDVSLWNDLCRQDKMVATWENINAIMADDEDSENALNEFISIEDNIQQILNEAEQETEHAHEIMNFLVRQPSIDAATRKQLFIRFANVITEIEPFLQNLGEPFSNLVEKEEITYIPKEDKELLDALKKVGYITKYLYTPGNKKYYIRNEYIK